MSTHEPGFQSFFSFLHHFALAKLATSSIRVKVKLHLAHVIDTYLSPLAERANISCPTRG